MFRWTPSWIGLRLAGQEIECDCYCHRAQDTPANWMGHMGFGKEVAWGSQRVLGFHRESMNNAEQGGIAGCSS